MNLKYMQQERAATIISVNYLLKDGFVDWKS